MPTFHHYVFCSPGPDPAWNQPNRAVRTRMLRGVGGGSREAMAFVFTLLKTDFYETAA